MQITGEMVILVLGLVGTVLGALANNSRVKTKARADQLVQAAEADKLEAEARLKQIADSGAVERAKAEANLRQTEALSQQMQHTGQMLNAQLVINQQLTDKYNGIRIAQDSGMERLWYHIDETGRKILAAVENIPSATVAGFTADSVGAFAEALGKQMGVVLAAELAKRDAERDMHPFPEAEDTAWEARFIVPKHDAVQMYKRPQVSDLVLLQKPCSRIAVEGETVRLIAGRVPGWYAVVKADCWGWLIERSIEVREFEPEAAG